MKIPTSIIIFSIAALPIASILHAENSQNIDISKVQLGDQAEFISENGKNLIRVDVSSSDKPLNIHLFDLDQPSIKQKSYALMGEVRYVKVTGQSYLETWNHMVAHQEGKDVPSKYFTRGLNPHGPMGVLKGSSEWRPFQLPFFMNTGDANLKGPTKIAFNLNLEGAGLVEIRNVKLMDGFNPSAKDMAIKISNQLNIIVLLMLAAIPVIVVALIVLFLRRKRNKRTVEELRRIQASDV